MRIRSQHSPAPADPLQAFLPICLSSAGPPLPLIARCSCPTARPWAIHHWTISCGQFAKWDNQPHMLRFHIIKHRDWKLEGDSDIRVYNFRTVLFIFKRESLLVCHKTAWIIYGWPLIIVLIYTWALFLVFSLMISIVYRYTKAYGRKYGAYTPYGI